MWNRRRNILDEFRRMQDEMDRMMGFVWSPAEKDINLLSHESGELYPSNMRQAIADVYETDKDLIATLEIPGVDKKDIHIDLGEKNLRVKVEKKKEETEEKKGVYRLERSYSGFYRSIPLPEYADKDKVNATYNNGVLEIRIPKMSIKEKGYKRIEVK
jgi:HSP20 family protein